MIDWPLMAHQRAVVEKHCLIILPAINSHSLTTLSFSSLDVIKREYAACQVTKKSKCTHSSVINLPCGKTYCYKVLTPETHSINVSYQKTSLYQHFFLCYKLQIYLLICLFVFDKTPVDTCNKQQIPMSTCNLTTWLPLCHISGLLVSCTWTELFTTPKTSFMHAHTLTLQSSHFSFLCQLASCGYSWFF